MTETQVIQFYQGLLGLNEDFFITWNWGETETDFKMAIKQNLQDRFEQIDFEENQDTNLILESIGFECNIADRLVKIFGPEIQDPNILWPEIHAFVQVRLEAMVTSHPSWSKNEQVFEVYNSKEKRKMKYQSILIPSSEGASGSNESLKKLTATSSDPSSATKTWYHATTFRDAEEIMKNGFRFRSCMKNRNYSDQDGIYFTDSIASAKHLFQHNAFIDCAVFPDTEYKKRKTPAEPNQHRVVVLAFTYHKKKNNLLEHYKKHSIDLRDHADEERLKKVVRFFHKHPLPTNNPTVEKHGLDSNYEEAIEYIIGPHAVVSNAGLYINREITQLCIRCVGRTSMKKEFEELIQKKVFVLDLDAKDICK
jgi:hypothetical protein